MIRNFFSQADIYCDTELTELMILLCVQQIDVIIYSCHNHEADLANLCKQKMP